MVLTASEPRTTAEKWKPAASGRRAGRRGFHNYVLVTPAYSVFALFLIAPIGAALWYSLFNFSIVGMSWAGLSNYRSVLTDPSVAHALLVTVVFTVIAVVIGMSIALAIAMLLYPLPIRVRNSLRSLLYLPAIVPVAATAIIWKWVYNYAFGLLNYLLGLVGLGPFDWLGSPHLALPSVAAMLLATGLGAPILILLAAIDAVPADVVDAAKVDRAGSVRIFFRILLPMIKPALLYLVVIQTIAAFQVFAPFVLMTKGGPDGATTTLGYQVYATAFESMTLEFGRASTLAVLMLILISALAAIEFRLLRSDVEY